MSQKINLNADLGESFGAWSMGSDSALLDVVGSANVACGFHGGDPLVMRQTVRAARERGVSIGAHPSFPDLQGFGRRRMDIPADELAAMLIYQIGALQTMAAVEGHALSHVKPHGALNNMACADARLADVVAAAVAAVDRDLILLAPAHSQLALAGIRAGLAVGLEVFADRAYQDDGQLVPRSQPGAMIHGAEASLQHVLRMLDAGGLVTRTGNVLKTDIHSICVHGDGPDAVASACALAAGLEMAGYSLSTLPQTLRP
ncbi:LamB/YcsF family protein [Dechloromonas sp. ARDL1]|uniref:LamB/YcsF family protein n=1 Tax=Dechloromonas sp. ARDL1 TaxID=3322121 RepID=UPI003DA75B8A